MDTTVLIVVVAVIAAAVAAWFLLQRQKSRRLKARFGPEYDRALQETGNPRQAEALLQAREQRVREFGIRPLPPEDSRRFAEAWRRVQARFVDDPSGAVSDADRLVDEVMHARGYPVADFEQRAADLSVEHGPLVENYRSARRIAERHGRGEAGTEELRQALVHYRALFEDLLGTGAAAQEAAARERGAREAERREPDGEAARSADPDRRERT